MATKLRSPRIEAFTLLELLLVMAIMAALAAVAIGGVRYALERSRGQQAQAEIAMIGQALEFYRRGHGDYPRFPDSSALLHVLEGAGCSEIDRLHTASGRLVDPWGVPYGYAYRPLGAAAWRNPRYVLVSAGPDRVPSVTIGESGFPNVAENCDDLTSLDK